MKKLLFLFVMLFALVGISSAQSFKREDLKLKKWVGVQMGVSANMPTSNPDFVPGAGIVVKYHRFISQQFVQLFTANQDGTDNGTQFAYDGGYFFLVKNGWAPGFGFRVSHIDATHVHKTTTRTYLGLAKVTPDSRLTAKLVFPSDSDPRNLVLLRGELERKIKGPWGLFLSAGVTNYRNLETVRTPVFESNGVTKYVVTTVPAGRTYGATASAGVKYWF